MTQKWVLKTSVHYWFYSTTIDCKVNDNRLCCFETQALNRLFIEDNRLLVLTFKKSEATVDWQCIKCVWPTSSIECQQVHNRLCRRLLYFVISRITLKINDCRKWSKEKKRKEMREKNERLGWKSERAPRQKVSFKDTCLIHCHGVWSHKEAC